jgi:hypothetical protein
MSKTKRGGLHQYNPPLLYLIIKASQSNNSAKINGAQKKKYKTYRTNAIGPKITVRNTPPIIANVNTHFLYFRIHKYIIANK